MALAEHQPQFSALAAALQNLRNEFRNPQVEFNLSPIGELQELLLSATSQISSTVENIFEKIPAEVQELMSQFLSGKEEAYRSIPTVETSKLWRILSVLSLLSFLMAACGKPYQEGDMVVLGGDMPVVINPNDWADNRAWYQGQSNNCYLQPQDPFLLKTYSDNGGAVWAIQDDCQGWLPVTHL